MKIDISHPKKEFENHLEIEGNKRIIFSGPFGIGKTTFIKEFSEINKEKYNVIHLFPVNYSVSSNEDIFELIKYDLFYEILKFKPIVDETAISKLELLPFFAKQELHKLIHIFLKAIPKIGKPISEVLNDLDSLVGRFKEEHKAINKTEFGHIASFIKEMAESTGSIYEFDFYSSLIKSLLENIKSAKEEGGKIKENILVVDDLDRVDPDHLFRLLNVFAAHVDFDKEEDNKFGFEKVIFVLDIKNAHNIFKNRYGQNVDSSGYLDKFFSKEVFNFDNRMAIENSVHGILKSVKGRNINFFDDYTHLEEYVSVFIRLFLVSESLNLRSLSKIKESFYEPKTYILKGERYQSLDSKNLDFCLIIDFLIMVMGSQMDLKLAIEKCSKWRGEDLIKDKKDVHHFKKVSFLVDILDLTGYDIIEEEGQMNLRKIEINGVSILYKKDYSIEIMAFKGADGKDINLSGKQYFDIFSITLDKWNYLKN
jgi:hypothetical protein